MAAGKDRHLSNAQGETMSEAMMAWISGFFSGSAVTIACFYAVNEFRKMRDED